eukprot:TRINITY_DN3557_c0_g1_i7.p1 TRINITY_DN3557_c0_g1~~TRINITY_DN3557_c0_g1_i7.p1  ORF type:complete len:354 (+),score=21.54 TRINITY_DN3557_c0_g1_i7:115-1062(+)
MCIRDRVSTQSTWGKFVSMSERRTAIVMLGDAGSGKTTLARAISTQRSELVVVDTPAIRGGQLGDIRALKALIHGLAGKTSVNAFVLIWDFRAQSDLQTLRHLQLAERLFPGLWQHVIVVVSHWSERPPNLTERDIKASVSLRLRDSLSVLVPLPFLFTELVPIDSVEEFALRQTIDVITQFALTRSPYNLRALNQSALEDLRVREEAETESMSKRWSFRVVSLAVWLLLPTAAAFFCRRKEEIASICCTNRTIRFTRERMASKTTGKARTKTKWSVASCSYHDWLCVVRPRMVYIPPFVKQLIYSYICKKRHKD